MARTEFLASVYQFVLIKWQDFADPTPVLQAGFADIQGLNSVLSGTERGGDTELWARQNKGHVRHSPMRKRMKRGYATMNGRA